MADLGQPAGRAVELVVGLVVGCIAVACLVLALIVVARASLEATSWLVFLALAGSAYGFGTLAYRLLCNRPRADGRLVGWRVLKLLCLLLGVASMVVVITALYSDQFFAFLTGLWLLLISLAGLRSAHQRASRHQ